MSKFNHSDRFNLEKQFVNRHSADAYVDLMIEDREYEGIEYFLFEQSHDYQHKEEGWKGLIDEEVVQMDEARLEMIDRNKDRALQQKEYQQSYKYLVCLELMN